ncbi:MAG: ester cyclase [Rhodospirillales bacterium]|nr:ester cyclase [Rhodospirillales bacterium]
MSIEQNKTVVRRYFEEVLDQGRIELLDELFSDDIVFHRGDYADPVTGLAGMRQVVGSVRERYGEFTTTLHHMAAEGDLVACRLSHETVHLDYWKSRIGTHQLAGKPIRWTAHAHFRLLDGKVVEEWVERDELGMALSVGVLTPA